MVLARDSITFSCASSGSSRGLLKILLRAHNIWNCIEWLDLMYFFLHNKNTKENYRCTLPIVYMTVPQCSLNNYNGKEVTMSE